MTTHHSTTRQNPPHDKISRGPKNRQQRTTHVYSAKAKMAPGEISKIHRRTIMAAGTKYKKHDIHKQGPPDVDDITEKLEKKKRKKLEE